MVILMFKVLVVIRLVILFQFSSSALIFVK